MANSIFSAMQNGFLSNFSIGQRVCSTKDNEIGTIRYIGLLPHSSTTVWFGIEWDSPQRGVHDGTFNGYRYFKCLFPPFDEKNQPRCSFVQAAAISGGISFYDALKKRYLPETDSSRVIMPSIVEDNTHSISFEFVGEGKADAHFENIYQLDVMVLSHSFISTHTMNSLHFHQLKILNLDHNLLSEWKELFSILKSTPSLQLLYISRNRFSQNGEVSFLSPPLNSLTELFLDSTYITWKELAWLRFSFPSVTTLSVCDNAYEDLSWEAFPLSESPTASFSSFLALEKLFISKNLMKEWKSVFLCILCFPSLRFLALNENFLTDQEDGDVFEDSFRQVINVLCKMYPLCSLEFQKKELLTVCEPIKYLWIEKNNIRHWKTLGDLRRSFPTLCELRWQGNPLHKDTAKGGVQFSRMIIISLWPHLNNLNGGTITKEERYTAERYFLSLVNQQHPCIECVDALANGGVVRKRLQCLHGDMLLVSSPHGDSSETSEFSRSLIRLHFFGDSAHALAEKQEIFKNIPNTMRIREVKTLCARLFHIPATYQRLLYNNGKMPLSMQFDDEQRDLRFYGVSDNYIIRVQDIRETQ